MFEFGRELRKLFAQARDSEDLSWLELIGADLLEVEARQQSVDAGRVSCARPCAAALRASTLWREHARRTGSSESTTRALRAAAEAACAAMSDDEATRAAIAVAQTRLLRFDLTGGLEFLQQAATGVAAITAPRRGDTAAALAGVQARIGARQARAAEDSPALMAALPPMKSALARLGRHANETDDLRLEQAALALELGIQRRDPALLDEAGRDLRGLVEAASPDYRPLTRARALTLCAMGLSALSELAGNAAAAAQAHEMFDAAVDQFTPDHSPLDWVAVQIVRGSGTDAGVDGLIEAEALTRGQGLVLGAMARDLRLSRQIETAEAEGDLAVLSRVETEVRAALSRGNGPGAPLDWAVDQIAMGRCKVARAAVTGEWFGEVGMALTEAAAVAREHGVPAIALRAETLAQRLAERV